MAESQECVIFHHRRIGPCRERLTVKWIDVAQMTNGRLRAAIFVDLSRGCAVIPPISWASTGTRARTVSRLSATRTGNNLIDRILAAFAAVQPIPKDEQVVFRRELENQLKAFNPFCLRPV